MLRRGRGWGVREKVWRVKCGGLRGSVGVHTLGEGQVVESERAQLGAVMMTND